MLLIAFSVIGFLTTLSLILYCLRDRLKACPFCSSFSEDEPEEDMFDTDSEDSKEEAASEKEEKHASQAKIRRGYIPLKFHTHDDEEV